MPKHWDLDCCRQSGDPESDWSIAWKTAAVDAKSTVRRQGKDRIFIQGWGYTVANTEWNFVGRTLDLALRLARKDMGVRKQSRMSEAINIWPNLISSPHVMLTVLRSRGLPFLSQFHVSISRNISSWHQNELVPNLSVSFTPRTGVGHPSFGRQIKIYPNCRQHLEHHLLPSSRVLGRRPHCTARGPQLLSSNYCFMFQGIWKCQPHYGCKTVLLCRSCSSSF